jgi:predicted 3-demethylubiquinone-9 3-methyltransferase (glyoxalase superfamily)
MEISRKITPCLWFDGQAEEAADFYVGIVRNSKITTISRYNEEGREIHGGKPGSVMVVAFELDGQPFTALNGGPRFKFNEAISLQVFCDTQEEIDYYWERLSAGGDAQAQQCGWLRDRYGLSWQVIPIVLPQLLTDRDTAKARRAMAAMLEMKKFDIATIERAGAAG